MINRFLLRIKVIQILYAYYKGEDQNYGKAEGELKDSIEKTYDLYCYLLLLIPALTEYAELRTSRKGTPNEIEGQLLPSKKFTNNLLAKQIAENAELKQYAEEHELSWASKKSTVLRSLLDDIINFDLYQKYNEEGEENDYEADKELWKKIFRQVIGSSEVLGKDLEETCIYWNADMETVHSFVVKTLKAYKQENGANQELLPMLRDEEDREYVDTLLKNAIYHAEEYNKMIDSHIDSKKWDSDRIAFMDRIIMQVAISELISFPTIPVNVSLNEYIEIAKEYSTEKSGTFINGVLDALVNDLRKEKKLMKVAFYSNNKKENK